MATKVYKMVLMFVDHDELGPGGAKGMLEHIRYPNHTIPPIVIDIQEREVEWSDDHPLNNPRTCRAEFGRLFESSGNPAGRPRKTVTRG